MSSHTANTELKFLGKLIIDGELLCETGLHIGAGKGTLEIGGADNPVVKDAFGRPYVPGSSLRGRLRSLLEQALGMAVPAELTYVSRRKGQEVRIHSSDAPNDEICLLFGRAPGRVERVQFDKQGDKGEKGQNEALNGATITPARLTVYDAPLLLDSITAAMRESLDDELTEVKSESAIDRVTSQSQARTLERVPAGASFKLRLVLDLLCEEDKELVPVLVQGLSLLEDDTLGGGGSRGSGRVRFANLKLTWRGADFYKGGAETDVATAADLSALRAEAASLGQKLGA